MERLFTWRKQKVRELTKKVSILADTSGHIETVLWNDHIDQVEVGKSYKLTNGSVRKYGQEIHVTTIETETTVVDNLLETVTFHPEERKFDSIDTIEIVNTSNCI